MSTIIETVNRMRDICLAHKDIKSFYVGNTWNMSNSKGDVYPSIWCEFPILIDYTLKQKTFTFSLDVLMLPKQDDVNDEIEKESECEKIADQLLQAFKLYIAHFNMGKVIGLTVKNINADIACGVRVDVQFILNRECDMDVFTKVLIRE